jgi:hypothetical protein
VRRSSAARRHADARTSVRQTASATLSAYERPSEPIQVTRGNRQKETPATSAMVRVVTRRARATRQPAATPVTTALGRRRVNGEYPTTSIQACMSR